MDPRRRAGIRKVAIAAAAALMLAFAPAIARESAMTAIYAIRYTPGPAFKPGVPLMRQDLAAHGAYMRELADAGIILAAGPLMTHEGGLVLLRAESLEAAQARMAADPAVVAGVFVGKVSEWRPVVDPAGRFASPEGP